MRLFSRHFVKSTLAAAALLTAGHAAMGQNNTVSPYSRFGYGVLSDHASSAQRAMGGVGYAMNNGRQINVMNPASYAAIDTLTFLFDIGGDLKKLSTSQGETSGSKTTAGLSNVNMQFPLGRRMGGSVGLLPYSEVGYSFGREIVNGEQSNQGSGTISELYLGVSGKIIDGLTVGANFSYLFGNLLNDTYMTSSNGSTSLFERVIEVKDFDLRLGVQYSRHIGTKHRVSVGAVYSPGKDFRGHTYGVKYDIRADVAPDTVGYSRLQGNFSRPATYGLGVNYEWNGKLMVEADVTYQPWSKCKFGTLEGFERTRFSNRYKGALGVQYQPDPRGGYLKRVRYRVGGFYNRDYIMIGNNNVNDIGITCGFGLPAPVNRLTKTVVNVGFEYRHRQCSPVALVKENYFQVTIGVNFNELWFWQNKIQ